MHGSKVFFLGLGSVVSGDVADGVAVEVRCRGPVLFVIVLQHVADLLVALLPVVTLLLHLVRGRGRGRGRGMACSRRMRPKSMGRQRRLLLTWRAWSGGWKVSGER